MTNDKSDEIKKLGYCLACGDSLWEGIEHKCEPPRQNIDRTKVNPLVAEMINALVLAEIEMSGDTDKLEPYRAIAAVRRVLWKLQLSTEEKFFCRIQTTVEACPPTSWD
jgi:hypothetical protein